MTELRTEETSRQKIKKNPEKNSQAERNRHINNNRLYIAVGWGGGRGTGHNQHPETDGENLQAPYGPV